MNRRINCIIKALIIVTSITCFSSAFCQTPIYLNLISHNEVTDTFDYKNSSADYWLVTNIARELADTIISKKAKWNIQVDGNYIIGNIKHDNAYTNNNDLLEWASKSAYIDVDGHNHFDSVVNPYNFADLAHLLQDSCGVVFSKNLTAGSWQTPIQTWTQYQNPVNGYTFKSYVYQADLLWGGGSPGHTNDINDFGVWKPTAPTNGLTFRQHSATNHLTYIGGGCKDEVSFAIDPKTGKIKYSTDEIVRNVKFMADYFNSLTPTGNEFYTLNMVVNFRDFPNIPSFADSIAKIIDGLDSYVKNGKIVWATLAEKYNMWYNQHTNPNDHFNYECQNVPLAINQKSAQLTFLDIYPNPTHGSFTVESDVKIYGVEINSIAGKLVQSAEYFNDKQVTVPFDLPPGLYLLRITTSAGTFVEKLVARE